MCPAGKTSRRRGGIDISGHIELVEGDIVAGDKIVNEFDVDKLVAALGKRGVLKTAEDAGLQQRTIIMLAQRLKPDERLSFDQALTELERAVEVALEVIAQGARGTNDDALVGTVLARVAERIKANDLDGGARSVDYALAQLEVQYQQSQAEREARRRRSQVMLLEQGIKVDTLRRDAVSVAQRIERIVAIENQADRPAWLPAFREKWDEYWESGTSKGINFSLVVAVELARRMVATARN